MERVEGARPLYFFCTNAPAAAGELRRLFLLDHLIQQVMLNALVDGTKGEDDRHFDDQ
jgi:hypothetical protein